MFDSLSFAPPLTYNFGATSDTSLTGKTCPPPNPDSLQPPGFGPVGFGHSARQSDQRQLPFQRWAFINRDSRYLPQGRDGHGRACCRRGRDFRQQWQGRPIWAASTLRATGMGSGGSGDLAGPWVVSQYGFI